jgi:hypothetical protein
MLPLHPVICHTRPKRGLPTELVKAASWEEWIEEDDEDIRIIDLGETFIQGAEPAKLAQPGHLKAPETIFTDTFDYRVDLWRAGIMVRFGHLEVRRRVLTSIWVDLLICIWRYAISIPWTRRCSGCTNDQFRGGTAGDMAGAMDPNANGLQTIFETFNKSVGIQCFTILPKSETKHPLSLAKSSFCF